MKQILQDLQSGETLLSEVPAPSVPSGGVLVATSRTLVSAGTERMLVDFGRGNLIQKAQQQPDKVRQVLEKVQTDGLLPTVDAVRNKLSTPLALGYCNVGTVVESRCSEFEVGDRVVSNGKHAEFVAVPKNLCAKIPDSVDDDTAAFTVIAAIALQGIRLVKPTLGETVVVTGLGLIGLVAVQLLRAHGCRVLGLDYDKQKLELAREFGAETVDLSQGQDPLAAAAQFSRGRGVDAVLITASTKSNEPVHQAATMCRKRGRIVLVGVVGMEFSRADFYEKELSFQVSCSYGPGRYDPEYEDKGHDYPVAFVRWTEQRNFEAILDMMSDGRVDMGPLVSHRFSLDCAAEAYDLVSEGNPLGVLLEYSAHTGGQPLRTVALSPANAVVAKPAACIGFIGAGNYAASVLVPAFSRTGARLKNIASNTGVSSVHVGKKFGVELATTDTASLLQDEELDALVVTTRHNSHADWICKSFAAGKHVFIEKPVALNRRELGDIEQAHRDAGGKLILMAGFNRRYSPLVNDLKNALNNASQPAAFIMTVNAGSIPQEHWTQDLAVGGGRIIGEACHFIDLLRYLAAAPVSAVHAIAMDSVCRDSVSIQLEFGNGSIGSITYLANGHRAFPKERLEVFSEGRIATIDNFRSIKSVGWKGLRSRRLLRQDKGQLECTRQFVKAINTGDTGMLIPFGELVEVANASFDVAEQVGQVLTA